MQWCKARCRRQTGRPIGTVRSPNSRWILIANSLVGYALSFASYSGLAHRLFLALFLAQTVLVDVFLFHYAGAWMLVSLLVDIPLGMHMFWYWRKESADRAAPTEWVWYCWMHAAKVVILFCRVMPRLPTDSVHTSDEGKYVAKGGDVVSEHFRDVLFDTSRFFKDLFAPPVVMNLLLITPLLYSLLMFRVSRAIHGTVMNKITVDLIMHFDMLWHVAIDMVDQVSIFRLSRLAEVVGHEQSLKHKSPLVAIQSALPFLLFLSIVLQAQVVPSVASERWDIPDVGFFEGTCSVEGAVKKYVSLRDQVSKGFQNARLYVRNSSFSRKSASLNDTVLPTAFGLAGQVDQSSDRLASPSQYEQEYSDLPQNSPSSSTDVPNQNAADTPVVSPDAASDVGKFCATTAVPTSFENFWLHGPHVSEESAQVACESTPMPENLTIRENNDLETGEHRTRSWSDERSENSGKVRFRTMKEPAALPPPTPLPSAARPRHHMRSESSSVSPIPARPSSWSNSMKPSTSQQTLSQQAASRQERTRQNRPSNRETEKCRASHVNMERLRIRSLQAILQLMKRHSIFVARKKAALISIFFVDLPFLAVRFAVWSLCLAEEQRTFTSFMVKNGICIVLNVIQFPMIALAARVASNDIIQQLAVYRVRFGAYTSIHDQCGMPTGCQRQRASPVVARPSPPDREAPRPSPGMFRRSASARTAPNPGASPWSSTPPSLLHCSSPNRMSACEEARALHRQSSFLAAMKSIRSRKSPSIGVCPLFWTTMISFAIGVILAKGETVYVEMWNLVRHIKR